MTPLETMKQRAEEYIDGRGMSVKIKPMILAQDMLKLIAAMDICIKHKDFYCREYSQEHYEENKREDDEQLNKILKGGQP